MAEKKLPDAETVGEELQNVQVSPTGIRVEVNDKLSKVIFKRNYDTSTEYKIVERKAKKTKSGKVKAKVTTNYTVINENGEVKLTEFDRAVLSVCISEQKAGNRYTTINMIFRALTGRVGEVAVVPYPKQRDEIEKSIKRLMGTIVDFKNLGGALKELGYTTSVEDGNIKASSLLPAMLLDIKINGQEVKDVLYFDRESPLLALAEKKNQIVRYPAELLDVPDQNNTPLIISLKTYVLRRVAEIKAHKMTPTITFDDVFKKCGIGEANRHKKIDARESVLKLFEHLRNKNFITSYEVVKRGVNVYAINFTYNSKGQL